MQDYSVPVNAICRTLGMYQSDIYLDSRTLGMYQSDIYSDSRTLGMYQSDIYSDNRAEDGYSNFKIKSYILTAAHVQCHFLGTGRFK